MTYDPQDLENFNPLLRDAIESITYGMATAFDEVWTRPDAAELVDGFLAGNVIFQIDRAGITIGTTTKGGAGDANPHAN